MNTLPPSPVRERLAAFGAAAATTVAVLAGIGTLAQTQAGFDAAAQLQAQVQPALLQVVVVGQRPPALSADRPQQVLVVGQRAPRS